MNERRPVSASIVITSRNRIAQLELAIQSSLAQSGTEIEVLVYDDASSDGTADLIRRRYPAVRLFADTTRRGLVVRRNQGFRDARGEFIFSLDDDAFFMSPSTLFPGN